MLLRGEMLDVLHVVGPGGSRRVLGAGDDETPFFPEGGRLAQHPLQGGLAVSAVGAR